MPFEATNEKGRFEWRPDESQIEEAKQIQEAEMKRMDHKYDIAIATMHLNDLLSKAEELTDEEVAKMTQIIDQQTTLNKKKGEISLIELKRQIEDIEAKIRADQ